MQERLVSSWHDDISQSLSILDAERAIYTIDSFALPTKISSAMQNIASWYQSTTLSVFPECLKNHYFVVAF
jgi:hypothetical protein